MSGLEIELIAAAAATEQQQHMSFSFVQTKTVYSTGVVKCKWSAFALGESRCIIYFRRFDVEEKKQEGALVNSLGLGGRAGS